MSTGTKALHATHNYPRSAATITVTFRLRSWFFDDLDRAEQRYIGNRIVEHLITAHTKTGGCTDLLDAKITWSKKPRRYGT